MTILSNLFCFALISVELGLGFDNSYFKLELPLHVLPSLASYVSIHKLDLICIQGILFRGIYTFLST